MDLTGITRLVLSQTLQPDNTYSIDSILFAKQYSNSTKYEIVGSCAYLDVAQELKLFFFEQLSETNQDKLYNNPNQLWKTFQNEQLADSLKKLVQWMPSKSLICDYHLYSASYGKYWTRKNIWPFEEFYYNEILPELKQIFPEDSVYYYFDELSDYPLTNMYGEDSVIMLGDQVYFFYPAPDVNVYWIDRQPTDVFLMYSLNDKKKTLEQILFLDVINKQPTLVASISLSSISSNLENYLSLLKELEIIPSEEFETDWENALQSESVSAKHYAVSNLKQMSKLKKQFVALDNF
jgi:hypothetical protein